MPRGDRRRRRSRCARCRGTPIGPRSTAARLLDAFGRPGGDGGAALRRRPGRPLPRVVLGRRRRRPLPGRRARRRAAAGRLAHVNIGHLLGTGLLDAVEEARVARLLGRPRLSGGYGLRTLDAAHPSYNPLGYHTGSVWPHDTAIAIDGLARRRPRHAAARLTPALLAAAPRTSTTASPSCSEGAGRRRPAARLPGRLPPPGVGGGAVARAAAGRARDSRADVPEGVLIVAARSGVRRRCSRSTVRGLRVAGHRLDVAVDADWPVPTSSPTAPLRVLSATTRRFPYRGGHRMRGEAPCRSSEPTPCSTRRRPKRCGRSCATCSSCPTSTRATAG